MDAADLKFFEQVAQSGGISRAAEKLNTVQSNVTRRIRALESELNVSLFNRTGRGVSPRRPASGCCPLPFGWPV